MADLSRAKGFYQYLRARLPQIWADATFRYDRDATMALARQNLGERRFDGSAGVNFLMIVPIAGWESALIDAARKRGRCHHLGLRTGGYFENTSEWVAFKAANEQKLAAFFAENHDPTRLNVVFTYLSDFYLNPEIIGSFRRDNTVIVNFSWDDILCYDKRHRGQYTGIRRLAQACDLNLTLTRSSLSRYSSDRSAVFYWEAAGADSVAGPQLPAVEHHRALFFGARYGWRVTLVEYLKKRGVPIDVFGSGWGGRELSHAELMHAIPRYAVTLGISTIGHTRNLFCLKGRDLEVPLAGGLYLTNDSLELRGVFAAGREVLTYCDKNDCFEKLMEAISNPGEFQAVREAGAKRAAALSWDKRFTFLERLIEDIIRDQR